jgi:hypothetical protein
LSCERFEGGRRTEPREMNRQIDFNQRSELNMKKICIRMVPEIFSGESEMGRREMLLFSKIEELAYLKTVVTTHGIMSQCISEIKYLRLLRLTEASMSKSRANAMWISSCKIKAVAH